MIDTQKILDAIDSDPSTLTLEEVDALANTYPFFIVPAVRLLQRDNQEHQLDPGARRRLLARIAINAPDSSRIMQLVDVDGENWLDFYPVEEMKQKTTEETIDTYLSTYGNTVDGAKETALLERLIFNPTPEYSQVLEQETDAPSSVATGDEQIDRINAFIASRGVAEASAPEAPKEEPAVHRHARKPKAESKRTIPQPSPDSSLTESLARIYIRQQKFAKAYEIIHSLSISQPDKNRFYADQLRFLRKAIIAQGGTPPVE